MSNTLLPCPFCGGEAKLMQYGEQEYLPTCNECDCVLDYCFYSAEEATAAWNRRAEPENEPLTLDELRQMDGEPVWMARAKKWVFVSTVVTEPYAQVWYFFKGFVYTVLYYHEKFYRNKPERSEGECGLKL